LNDFTSKIEKESGQNRKVDRAMATLDAICLPQSQQAD